MLMSMLRQRVPQPANSLDIAMATPPEFSLRSYWDSLPPARFANMILRRAGIEPLDMVRSREEMAALGEASMSPVARDVTVTYSAKR